MNLKRILKILKLIIPILILFIILLWIFVFSPNNYYKEEKIKDINFTKAIISTPNFVENSEGEAISYFWIGPDDLSCIKTFCDNDEISTEIINFGDSIKFIKDPMSTFIDDDGNRFVLSSFNTYFNAIDDEGDFIKSVYLTDIFMDMMKMKIC